MENSLNRKLANLYEPWSALTTAPTLLSLCHTDDTLDEEDVLMSWKYKTHICKSRSREQEFFSKFRFTLALVVA